MLEREGGGYCCDFVLSAGYDWTTISQLHSGERPGGGIAQPITLHAT